MGIYLKSLHSERTSFATLFGAVVGLAELGNEVQTKNKTNYSHSNLFAIPNENKMMMVNGLTVPVDDAHKQQRIKTCETFIFPLVRKIGERVAQVLDNPAASSEKLPAEKIRTQLTVSVRSCFAFLLFFLNTI